MELIIIETDIEDKKQEFNSSCSKLAVGNRFLPDEVGFDSSREHKKCLSLQT